jgi:hypothetical protein
VSDMALFASGPAIAAANHSLSWRLPGLPRCPERRAHGQPRTPTMRPTVGRGPHDLSADRSEQMSMGASEARAPSERLGSDGSWGGMRMARLQARGRPMTTSTKGGPACLGLVYDDLWYSCTTQRGRGRVRLLDEPVVHVLQDAVTLDGRG